MELVSRRKLVGVNHMKLYGYWRSTAAYRVRIALNLLGIQYQSISVHLVKGGGEQHLPSYEELNPSHLVPTLVDGDLVLSQSLAIIEYLDECYGNNSLLPSNPAQKAQARALAQDIACDVHPLNNLRVMQHLGKSAQFDDEDKAQWMAHWMTEGFSALEQRLKHSMDPFCVGKVPSIADICLIAQLYNARRFNVSLDNFEKLVEIEKNCLVLTAFKLAHPSVQPDAS